MIAYAQFFDAVNHMFVHCRTVDRIDVPKRRPLDRGFVVQESNTVFYCKNLGDATVLLADCIDEDELHPYRSSDRIRKDISVGCVRSQSILDELGGWVSWTRESDSLVLCMSCWSFLLLLLGLC